MDTRTLAVGLLFLACAGAPADSPAPAPPNLILQVPGGPSGTVTTDQSAYASGRPVRIEFVVRNTGVKPVRYEFGTAEQVDVAVRGPSGDAVWTWSQGRLFRAAASDFTLAPGKSRSYKVVWPGVTQDGTPAPPGSYTIVAWLASSDRSAITGSFVVNTDTDPTNSGLPPVNTDSGAIRAVNASPPVSATAKIVVTPRS
jgi:hypothetical protein